GEHRAQESGHHHEAARQGERDSPLSDGRARATRPDRQLISTHRRSDCHHAIAAGVVGPVGRTAGRRRIHPPDGRRHGAHLDPAKARVFAALERLLIGATKAALIIEYAEAVAPAGEPSFQGDADRAAIVTLHRWSALPEIERGDNVVLLVAENLTDLSPKLVSNPKVAVVEVPMPDRETRKAAAALADARLTERDAERYADITAGLKAIQISSI